MAYTVSVLDFGSEEISVFIGERGLNNTVRVVGMGVCPYSGFINGEILDRNDAKDAVIGAIAAADACCEHKTENLFFGIPNEFCVTACRNLTVNFPKKRKITAEDIQNLYATCKDYENLGDYDVIGINPIYFVLDSDRRLMDPEGKTSTSLSARVSFTLAERRFTDFMRPILAQAGVQKVEFVSTALAQFLELVPAAKRDNGVVIVDVGYLTTGVTVAKGDGIVGMRSFALGGGTIAGDITTTYEIPFRAAEKIKRSVMLSLAMGEDDTYEYAQGKTLRAKDVNQLVSERIRGIARAVDKCVKDCDPDFPDYQPYSLTGGGIALMKGAKEILSKVWCRKTEVLTPFDPQARRADLSSAWGLMNMALNKEFGKQSIWTKIGMRND